LLPECNCVSQSDVSGKACRGERPELETLKTGNSSYINDIFLNNLAGACSEIADFGDFPGSRAELRMPRGDFKASEAGLRPETARVMLRIKRGVWPRKT
jgi:hypothetical protein